MFTTPITAPSNFSSTETANKTSTTFASSGESTTSLSTLATTLQTPITSSDITTDTFETTSVQGGYNMTASENEGSGGVPIPAVVVPVVVFACVGLAVILILILRRRYLNSKSASPTPISTPQRDYDVEDGSPNNAYGSLQDLRDQEHRYSTIERATVEDVTPKNKTVTINDNVVGENFQPERNCVHYSPDYTNAFSSRKFSDDYLHPFNYFKQT